MMLFFQCIRKVLQKKIKEWYFLADYLSNSLLVQVTAL